MNYCVLYCKTCTVHPLITLHNEPTNAQFIILLLHVSTLLFHLQRFRSQYLLSYIVNMSMQSLVIQFKLSLFFLLSMFKIIKILKLS